jgi:hypothetical protein
MEPIHANNPCDCPPDACERGIDQNRCVNRLAGTVVTALCPKHDGAYTWHHNGECLACRRAEIEGV